MLSVQTNVVDSNVVYSVDPASRSWTEDGIDWHEWAYDPTSMLVVRVSMDKPADTQSHIIIANLSVDGMPINQFDQTGVYVRSDTQQLVYDAYGYMAWPGTYTFRIRYAPLMHNYITYLKQLARSDVLKGNDQEESHHIL